MRALARACRLIDERDPHTLALLKSIFRHDGHAYVLGVTGTPGAGKSTLVDGLIRLYREEGKRVAVLAIDPTSPYSGGAILGDRIRMQQHFTDEGVFIRSIATRGHLGGLSRSTGDVLHVLQAAKFDVVILGNRRGGAGRARGDTAGRHDARGDGAGARGRHSGDQGRYSRGGRRVCGQQGRPRWGGCHGAGSATDALASTRASRCGQDAGPHGGFDDSKRPRSRGRGSGCHRS